MLLCAQACLGVWLQAKGPLEAWTSRGIIHGHIPTFPSAPWGHFPSCSSPLNTWTEEVSKLRELMTFHSQDSLVWVYRSERGRHLKKGPYWETNCCKAWWKTKVEQEKKEKRTPPDQPEWLSKLPSRSSSSRRCSRGRTTGASHLQ